MSSELKDVEKHHLQKKKIKLPDKSISKEYREELEKIHLETHKKGKRIKIGTVRDFSKRYGL